MTDHSVKKIFNWIKIAPLFFDIIFLWYWKWCGTKPNQFQTRIQKVRIFWNLVSHQTLHPTSSWKSQQVLKLNFEWPKKKSCSDVLQWQNWIVVSMNSNHERFILQHKRIKSFLPPSLWGKKLEQSLLYWSSFEWFKTWV